MNSSVQRRSGQTKASEKTYFKIICYGVGKVNRRLKKGASRIYEKYFYFIKMINNR